MANNKVASLLRGYSFSFEDEGNQIKAWFSALSGLEQVYVNGKLVASQRNFSKKSSNTFSISGNEYSTSMAAISILKGPFVCTLTKNGRVLKRQKLIFPDPEKKNQPFFTRLWFWLIVGATFGVIKALLNLGDWTLFVFTGTAFLFMLIYYVKYNRSYQPFIEEDSDIEEENV